MEGMVARQNAETIAVAKVLQANDAFVLLNIALVIFFVFRENRV
jgi:hypothetical protein